MTAKAEDYTQQQNAGAEELHRQKTRNKGEFSCWVSSSREDVTKVVGTLI